MSRVLVVANDLVGRSMAGPGIRNYELAAQLAAAGNQVTLVAPGGTDLERPAVEVISLEAARLGELAAGADVVLSQGWVLEANPGLGEGAAALVVDLYDPFPLEGLEEVAGRPLEDQVEDSLNRVGALRGHLAAGDLFICASEKQRDYWLGALSVAGRVNPLTYARDPTLRDLVEVVPFGLPEAPPGGQPGAIRGRIPGIGAGELVLLWGGGLYDWFDPVTAVEGVGLARERVPEVRLVLLAGRHPNPRVQEMAVVGRTREAATRLGLLGSHVVLHEEWVPYARRAAWLSDADVGVSTHHQHIETRFSFRTRILDYLWAGLPVLCTAGDSLATTIRAAGAGEVVAPGSAEAVAEAIIRLADPGVRAEAGRRAAELAAGLTWPRVAEPLVRFCAAPRHAADRPRGAGREPGR